MGVSSGEAFPNMNPILEKILNTQKVEAKDGSTLPVHSCVPDREGKFLYQLVERVRPKESIEIGLGYGISSLYICEALKKNFPEAHHLILDPYQSEHWKGIGLENLKRAGYENLIEFREAFSHLMLPHLVAQNKKVDFAFVDGAHTFDYAFLDFFYLDLLLKVGGILAFDDADFPSVKKICRYLLSNRHYRLIGYSEKTLTLKEKIKFALKKMRSVPPEYVWEELRGTWARLPDARIMAFVKEGDDDKNWDFHREF